MYWLVILTVGVSRLWPLPPVPAVWSQQFTFETDCRRAEQALVAAFKVENVIVKSDCVLVR